MSQMPGGKDVSSNFNAMHLLMFGSISLLNSEILLSQLLVRGIETETEGVCLHLSQAPS